MESQPLGHPVQRTASSTPPPGLVEEGEVDVADMVARQPWDGDLPFRVRSTVDSRPSHAPTTLDSHTATRSQHAPT